MHDISPTVYQIFKIQDYHKRKCPCLACAWQGQNEEFSLKILGVIAAFFGRSRIFWQDYHEFNPSGPSLRCADCSALEFA